MTKKNNTIKSLTPTELKKQAKVLLDEKREFSVTVGETEYKLTHDVVFRKSKQSKFLEDVVSFFSEGANHPEILDLATAYSTLLIIKHFTSLDIPDDISEALNMLEVLVDLEILNPIVEELPTDQVTEIYELLSKTVKNMDENIQELQREAEEMSGKVENKELIDFGKQE